MTEERRARLWALFDQATDLALPQQRALLDAACPDDPSLRAEVEKLLADDARLRADEGTAAFLNSPLIRSPQEPLVPPTAADPAGRLALPARISHYRIVGLLGEGGMGTVYEAEQDYPRRIVALKVIRPGVIAPDLVKRFSHEAQILGRLQHPGIAQIHEAGLTADGQPFFVMELIRGMTLDRYVRSHALDAPACLELLARVCDAAQHAHDKGVIHRDLKPGNILVDETGQPKVLDFGVARATDADLQTTTGRTEAGQLLGTLGYMSPEQIAADPAALDRRSDVYALGVILFELLADRLPYHLEHLPLPEVARVIRDQEPSRLGSINARFRGDVETIVAKALAKDKARRYASAADLASDIRCYLRHEPIRARPPSALYQFRKFVRRHKGLVGGVAAVVSALVLGLIGTILFAVREAEQRSQAERNAQEANNEKQAALYQTYQARIAAAAAALQNHNVADAAHQLKVAPKELRDWEWHHLRSRLDDRSGRIVAEAGTRFFLFPRPHGLDVGRLTTTGLRLTDLDGRRPRTISVSAKVGRIGDILPTSGGLRFVDWVGDGTMRLWDAAGNERLRLTASEGIVRISPDGSRLAVTRSRAGLAGFALYETASGKRTAICTAHREDIWAVAFSADSTRIASGGEDGLVCVWDATTGAKITTCRGHDSKVLSVAFRPDGARLITTSADGTVRQWNPATGRAVEPPYDRHTGDVLSAAYSPDGKWVASGSADRTVRLWRARGRKEVAVLHGHQGDVNEVAFTPDGRRLASVSQNEGYLDYAGDGTVGIWEVADLPVLRGHEKYVYPAAFSPDGRWIASGSWDHTVRLWEAATGGPCATLRHPDIVRALAFDPDGRWLVTGSEEEDRLRIWDVGTARVRQELRGPGKSVRFLAVSPDGTRIAATAYDPQRGHHFSVCEVSSGEQLYSSAGAALAYSPDGRWLATRSAEGDTVVLLDGRTHQAAARFAGHEALIYSAAFSSDSRRLASCGADHTVRLWEIDGGACRVLPGHTDHVFAVAFHPGGTRLASAGRDQAIRLWDLAKGEEVARLHGHTNYIWSLAFSPDGKTLVSGSGDSTVRLWDTQPLARRYQARRQAEALRPEAERLVERLFREKKDPAAVVSALREDTALSEPRRQAALRAVLRRQ